MVDTPTAANGPAVSGGRDVRLSGLNRTLGSWQVFFISLSAIIGSGLFSFNGLAIRLAGPAGYLIANLYVAVTAVCFMDGLSEMIQVFPCSNATIEYVRSFVDDDLGTVIGWVYWLAWSIIYTLQLTSVGQFISAWLLEKDESTDKAVQSTVVYVILPLFIFLINVCRVDVFGWFEAFFGCLKLLVSAAIGLMLFYLGGRTEVLASTTASTRLMSRETFLSHPWGSQVSATTIVGNTLLAIPLVTYSWIGIDIIAVTAFEVLHIRDLRLSSQRIAYVLFFTYAICGVALGIGANTMNSNLASPFLPGDPAYDGHADANADTSSQGGFPLDSSHSIIVIIANMAGQRGIANFFNIFLVFASFSAANSALYVASRTLYGLSLARQLPGGKYGKKVDRWVGSVTSVQVPVVAVGISALCPFWILWLGLAGLTDNDGPAGTVDQHVSSGAYQFINATVSSSVICVWGAQSLAFLRYHYGLKKHGKSLIEQKPRYDRSKFKRSWDPDETAEPPGPNQPDESGGSTNSSGGGGSSEASRRYERIGTPLAHLQPWVSGIALVGCILIVTVFPSSLLWADSPRTAAGWVFDIFQVFTAPLLILGSWLSLKLTRYLSNKWKGFYVKFVDEDMAEDAVVEGIFRDLEVRSTQSNSKNNASHELKTPFGTFYTHS